MNTPQSILPSSVASRTVRVADALIEKYLEREPLPLRKLGTSKADIQTALWVMKTRMEQK